MNKLKTFINKKTESYSILGSPALPSFLILVILFLVAAFFSDAFFSSKNISNVLREMAPLGIVALGQMFVMVSGAVDLSVGSTITLSCIICCGLMKGSNVLMLPVILLCILVGVLIGLLNGFVVNRLKVVPFMATLGTLTLLEGIGLIITQGAPLTDVTVLFRKLFGTGYFLGIPSAVIIYAVLFIVFSIIFYFSSFGRKIFAVGGNEKASKISGINTNRIRTISYIISGVLASVAGVILAARTGSADNWIGIGYNLDSIAASIIGGSSLAGGVGSLFGAVFGVSIMSIIKNFLNLLAVNPFIHETVVGVVIVSTVAVFSARK